MIALTVKMTLSLEHALNDEPKEEVATAIQLRVPRPQVKSEKKRLTNGPLLKKVANETVPLNLNGKFGYIQLTTEMQSEVQFTLTLRS
jgi:hypothetical protein